MAAPNEQYMGISYVNDVVTPRVSSPDKKVEILFDGASAVARLGGAVDYGVALEGGAAGQQQQLSVRSAGKAVFRHDLGAGTLLLNPDGDFSSVSIAGGGASNIAWNKRGGFTSGAPVAARSEWALAGGNLSLVGPDGGTRFVLAVDGDKLGVYKVPAAGGAPTLVTFFK